MENTKQDLVSVIFKLSNFTRKIVSLYLFFFQITIAFIFLLSLLVILNLKTIFEGIFSSTHQYQERNISSTFKDKLKEIIPLSLFLVLFDKSEFWEQVIITLASRS